MYKSIFGNLCSGVVNLQRLFCDQEAGVWNVRIEAFWYIKKSFAYHKNLKEQLIPVVFNTKNLCESDRTHIFKKLLKSQKWDKLIPDIIITNQIDWIWQKFK